MLIVKSKIKEAVGDLNVASDFGEALDKRVREEVHRACERCKANGRKTVRGTDL